MKVNGKYLEFFEDNRGEDYLILQGGKRAGKTTAILQDIDRDLKHTPNRRALIVTDTFARLRESLLSDFQMIRAEHPQLTRITGGNTPRIDYYNGSAITFTCSDRDARGFTSDKNRIFFNECILYGESLVRDIMKSGADDCQVVFDYNPYTRFYVNDNYENGRNKLITTYKDNPFCPRFAREQLEKQAEIGRCAGAGTMERYIYEVECLGLNAELSGLCFQNTEVVPDSVYDDCPVPEILASDWGQVLSTADPDVICGFKFDGERILCREYYYRNDGTDVDIAETLGSIPFNRQWFVYETATAGEARVRNIYNASGLRYRFVPCSKGVGSVMIGIRNLQAFKVCITESSKNFQNEQRNYKYITKGDIMMPADRYNHCFDCLRYAYDFYVGNKNKLVA